MRKNLFLMVIAVLIFALPAVAQYRDIYNGKHGSLAGAIIGSSGNQVGGVMADNIAMLYQIRGVAQGVGQMYDPYYGGGYYPGYGYPGGISMPQGQVGRGIVGGILGALGGAAVGGIYGGGKGAKIGLAAGAGAGILGGALTGGEEKIHVLLRNAFESCLVRVYQDSKQIVTLSPGTEKRVKIPVSATIWAEAQVVNPQTGKLFWIILEPSNGMSNLPGNSGFVFHNPELNSGKRR